MDVIDNILYYIYLKDARQANFRHYANAGPVGCAGQPEDIAQAIALLVRNTFITGQVITVDSALML